MSADAAVDGHEPESARAGPAMRLELAWCLPRQAATVAMVRRLLDTALTLMDISVDCRADLALALTEACANAVQHAHGASDYQVLVNAGPDRCVVDVIDTGVGLDHQRVIGSGIGGDRASPSPTGRGLRLIRACTDTVETHPVHPRGLHIRMSKDLTGNADAPARP